MKNNQLDLINNVYLSKQFKALDLKNNWVFGMPTYMDNRYASWHMIVPLIPSELNSFKPENDAFPHGTSKILEGRSFLEIQIQSDTICMYTGVTIPPRTVTNDELPAQMIYCGDRVDLQGNIVVIENRMGYFGWNGSDYHIGTVKFFGSRPMVVGNIFDV